MSKETQTEKKVAFYKKAAFPYAIIIVAVAAFLGFAVGTHTERTNQQNMQQEFANGVASVKEQSPVKK